MEQIKGYLDCHGIWSWNDVCSYGFIKYNSKIKRHVFDKGELRWQVNLLKSSSKHSVIRLNVTQTMNWKNLKLFISQKRQSTNEKINYILINWKINTSL